MKITQRWMSVFLLFFSLFAHADYSVNGKSEEKQYQLSICALFKNEAKYLKEWIEYHRLIGVDHFYLYNNKSSDRYRDVLKPYVKEGIVTLTQWPDYLREGEEGYDAKWALSTQIPAYENAIKIKAAQETKWLAIVDVGEFLVPSSDRKMQEILAKYEAHPGLNFSVDCFDASSISLPNKKLLIETLEMVAQPEQNIQKKIQNIVFKPDQCLGFVWPPYRCIFKDNQVAVKVSRNEMRINRYVNRLNATLNLKKSNEKLHVDNRLMSEHDKASMLVEGYEIEDQEKAIYRFVPALLDKLGNGTHLAGERSSG